MTELPECPACGNAIDNPAETESLTPAEYNALITAASTVLARSWFRSDTLKRARDKLIAMQSEQPSGIDRLAEVAQRLADQPADTIE